MESTVRTILDRVHLTRDDGKANLLGLGAGGSLDILELVSSGHFERSCNKQRRTKSRGNL